MIIQTLLTEQTSHDLMETESIDLGLYRGLQSVLEEPVKLPIRVDRRPRDSSADESVVFDIAFQMLYSEPDIRRRCAFATTDVDTASFYTTNQTSFTNGSLVECRPLKTSTIAWHPNVSDSAMMLGERVFAAYRESHNRAPEVLDAISDMANLDGVTSSQGILDKALNTIHENEALTKEDRDHLVENFKRIFCSELQGYKIAPAASAGKIPEGVEVMIFNAPYYWAVPVEDQGFDQYD